MKSPFTQELAEVLGQQPALLFLGGPPADVAWALAHHNASVSRAFSIGYCCFPRETLHWSRAAHAPSACCPFRCIPPKLRRGLAHQTPTTCAPLCVRMGCCRLLKPSVNPAADCQMNLLSATIAFLKGRDRQRQGFLGP